MASVTFTLDTTTNHFINWVDQFTGRWLGQKVERDDGVAYALLGSHGCGYLRDNEPIHYGVPAAIYHLEASEKPIGVFFDDFVTFDVLPLAPTRIKVTIIWPQQCSQMAHLIHEMLLEVANLWPEAQLSKALGILGNSKEDDGEAPQGQGAEVQERKRGPLGLHGGTLDRVREVRKLIEDGEPKTRACKRVGIDPRTYDRYADLFVDWEADLDK